MMKKSAMILTALLAVMMLFTSCDEEKANPVQADERAVVTISTTLNEEEGTRTIKPVAYKAPDWYKITLTPHEIPGVSDPVVLDQVKTAKVDLTLKPGKWDVKVEGYINNGEKPAILTMTGVANSQILVANKPNNVIVNLAILYEAPGSVEVVFDWTENAETDAGPLKDALALQDASFTVVMKDANRIQSKREEDRVLAGVYNKGARSISATFNDIPATTRGRYNFEVRDKNDNLVISTGNIAVQVVSGQISKADTGSLNSFHLVEAPRYASSIRVEHKAYTIIDETSIKLNLNLKSGVDYINAYVFDESTGLQVGEGPQKIMINGGDIVVSNLVSGKAYTIKLQAHYKNGLMSPIDEFTELTSVKSWIPVESIRITNTIDEIYSMGSVFNINVEVLPEDATNKTYTINTVGDAFTREGNKFTATKLGKSTITVTSNDNAQIATEIKDIGVSLSNPETVTATATANSVKVEWTTVPQATGYELWKKTNDGEFSKLDISLNSEATSFEDTAIMLGEDYSYIVYATANELVSVSYDPKSYPTLSNTIMATASNITLVMPEVEEDLPALSADGAYVTPTGNLTVNLANEFPGATSYWWELDNVVIEKFNESRSVTVTYADLDLETGLVDHTLTLWVSTATKDYSTGIRFKHPTSSVVIESPDARRIPNTLDYSAKASIAKIDAHTTATGNTNLTYTSETPELASVSEDGYIEPQRNVHGTAIITVRDVYGATASITFDVYNNEYKEEKDVLEMVNGEIERLLRVNPDHDFYVEGLTNYPWDISAENMLIKQEVAMGKNTRWGSLEFTNQKMGSGTASGTLWFDRYGKKGYGGQNKLGWIGWQDAGTSQLKVKFEEMGVTATITYTDINIIEAPKSTSKYNIKFDKPCGDWVEGVGYTITDSTEGTTFSNQEKNGAYELKNRIQMYK